MVSWWPGDGSAQDIKDSNNGTIEGSLAFGAGRVAQAFDYGFGGNKDVLIGNPANLRITGSLTIDAWVRPNLMTEAQVGIVIAKWSETLGQDSYFLAVIRDPDGFIYAYGGIGTALPEPGIKGTSPLPVGQWSHLAMTYNTTTGENVLYVNGAVDESRVRAGGVVSSNVDVYLGRQQSAATPRYFTGLVDEVEIFDRELLPTEIQAIVDAGSSGKCKQPTAARVTAVVARSRRGTIIVSWRAGAQAGLLGYHVWRSGDGALIRINPRLVPAGRSSYRLVDARVRQGMSYTYRVRAVDLAGRGTWLGAARAVAR
jgi:concanavalin A-like lectin/glucanase superfamily protein